MSNRFATVLTCLLSVLIHARCFAAEANPLEREFESIKPLLATYCNDCHAGDEAEADIDLSVFVGMDDLRRQIKTWQQIDHVVRSRQMPPKDSDQPSDADRERLTTWLRSFLMSEAARYAGDPGPVTLRRLSNAEYTYTIRDLTGVDSLEPTREFPVDGAAGEGFTNTGDALSMSPALVQKYLTAAKQIASHAVLLPNGIRFSPYNNERDWTDEALGKIQQFYAQRTTTDDGTKVSFHGLTFDTDQGGRIPLEPYLAATLVYRDDLRAGRISPGDVATKVGLNAKYLTLLWRALSSNDAIRPSFLMDRIRRRWQSATKDDVGQLADEIRGWQKALWKFNTIGHIGRAGGPSVWMEPQMPLLDEQAFRVELPKPAADSSPGGLKVYFASASSTGDPVEQGDVVWRNARLERKGMPSIPLKNLATIDRRIEALRLETTSKIEKYLRAVATLEPSLGEPRPLERQSLTELAKQHELDETALNLWLDYLQVSEPSPIKVTGHYVRKIESSGGYHFVQGWGSNDTPSILANSFDDSVAIPGNAAAHGIVVHPSPELYSGVTWQSPIEDLVDLKVKVVDAHACGNGIEYIVRHRSAKRAVEVWRGSFDAGGSAEMPTKRLSVAAGDAITLAIGPRDGNHACDLTQIEMTLTAVAAGESKDQPATWSLAADVSPNILAGNPHADQNGNEAVWHFVRGPIDEAFGELATVPVVPNGSLLHEWQNATDREHRSAIAKRIQDLAAGPPPNEDADAANALLYRHLHGLVDGVNYQALIESHAGDHDFKATIGDRVEFQIPARFVLDAAIVAVGSVDVEGRSAQLLVSLSEPPANQLDPTLPIVAAQSESARNAVTAAFDEFRDVFPGALCYARIVPIDEVVTLTLFYRQDDELKRLMLSEQESDELDRLWDELFYVSHEPLKYAVAFEQIQAFSTQDRPDLVVAWKANIERTNARVEAFKQRLIDDETTHIKSIVELATRAWRRPLKLDDENRLQQTYASLRASGIAHDQATRLMIARVLTAPSFLYRLEQPSRGSKASPVADHGLASRLSYFLWSSMPDATLRAVADRGELTSKAALREQTRRMLRDTRTRRLAVQFACQWLHIRDFDQNDEKNETLYPEFAKLRGPMYEEALRFFEDMFRNDGSVLDLLNADHTFVNPVLAKHYGLATSELATSKNVKSDSWKRVAVRRNDRGGVLGMGAILASLSGASRTSPILRGNWVSETLLGERLPKPPADVPQLPESVPSGLSAREMIEQHSSNPDCAKCHARIDPYGFALEQFDAIGRVRDHSVDTKTQLFDGTTIEGIAGLRSYLVNQRRDDFLQQFCTKLLGYALAREVQLSDEPLIAEMKKKLGENDFRFSIAVEQIVESPQFRNIRGQDWTPK